MKELFLRRYRSLILLRIPNKRVLLKNLAVILNEGIYSRKTKNKTDLAKKITGNWGTLLLPIGKNEQIDFNRLGEELDYLIEAGLDGIYSNGTAGEFHNQTEAEFDRVQELMAEKCHRSNMRFQIGASHPSPVISLERLKRTKSLKPFAYQVILPDWVVTTREEQISFLQKMAEAADGIPLVLYNPPHARPVLAAMDFEALHKAVPQLAGIKTGAGDDRWYGEMKIRSAELSVFVPGHYLATGVLHGVASGAYSNVACLSPKGSQWWWSKINSDLNDALEIQERILKFFELCIAPYKNAGYSNPALDKYLAAIGGWANIGTRLRWPYKWIDERDIAKVREIAWKLLPEFFNT